MKKILTILCVMVLMVSLTACGKKKGKEPEKIDNTNVNIEELPDVKGDENVTVDKDGNKVNKSNEFGKEKTFDGCSITEAKITTNTEGRTVFTAKFTNNKGEVRNGGLVDIIFVDKDGNKVSKLPTYIRQLNASEVMEINATIDKDLSNAYNYYFDAK